MLVFLSVAVWWCLGEAIGHGCSALVVTLIWAIIAAVLAVLGRAALGKARGLPRTTDTVKNIPGALTTQPPGEAMTTSSDPDQIRADIERTRAACERRASGLPFTWAVE